MGSSKRRNAIFTIVVISALILIFTVADFFEKDRIFSEAENRLLAVKPQFTWEALLDGTYTADLENYLTDQFVSRDKWITMKTKMDVLLQKKEINGVYLGKDNYLLFATAGYYQGAGESD